MKEYEVPKAGNLNFWMGKDHNLMAIDSSGNDILSLTEDDPVDELMNEHGLPAMTDEEWMQSTVEDISMKRNQTFIDITDCPYDAEYDPTLVDKLRKKLDSQPVFTGIEEVKK